MEIAYPMIENALSMFVFLADELSALFILISAGVSFLQQYIRIQKYRQFWEETKKEDTYWPPCSEL